MTASTLRRPKGRRASARIKPWLFLVPGLLFAITFKFFPMIEGMRMSMFKVQPFLGDQFIGFDNYIKVLTDPKFVKAMGNTVVLGLGQAAGGLFIGLILALLLEGSARSLRIIRTAVFLPVVTAVAVVGEIWRILYFPSDLGFLNSILGMVGIGPLQFLSDPSTALFWVMVVGIWIQAPYNMVILLAGLAGIDRGLYEASDMDGATRWHRMRYIVLPGLAPAFSVVVTLAAIRALRIFTEVYVLTGGGPAGSTEVWMTRVYASGFEQYDLGVASAASTILLVVTMALTITVQMIARRKDAR